MKIDVHLNKKSTRQVERILKVNGMSMKEFASYAIAGVAECHSGNNVEI